MLVDNTTWFSRVYIGSIKLYKDGIIYYKRFDNGQKVEATMAYDKYFSNGTKYKVRYILVKDFATGAKHIIDMYTTHYE